MNRTDLLKLALVVVLSTAASAAYANTSITGATLMGGNSFAPSSNVTVVVSTDGSANSYSGNNYSARSKHSKGDKVIGCKSGDSKLYFTQEANVTVTTDLTSATGDTYSGWSTM